MKVIEWVNRNKFVTVLAVALLYLAAQAFLGISLFGRTSRLMTSQSTYGGAIGMAADMAESAPNVGMAVKSVSSPNFPIVPREVAPSPAKDRLVIQDTDLSVVVKDVTTSIKEVQTIAQTAGGFLVNSNLSVPEQSASGTIIIRVPAAKRDDVLAAIKALGTKVVSENVSGTDVTDQYEDLDTNIANLEATKARFEAIREDGKTVTELLEVTRELTNLQRQIDSYKGRQDYLKKSADLTKITVYLSTDELALPYTPAERWSPEAIFKEATRSLVRTARQAGTALIWAAVYSPVWLVLLAGYLLVTRRLYRKTT